MWQHGVGMGGMWIGWIVGLVVLIVIIWMIASIAGRSPSGSEHGSGEDSAQEILDRRYARGEIDDEQYRRMREQLNPH